MAEQIVVIKSIDAGIFEGQTLILRIAGRNVLTGAGMTVELPATSFKTVLTETGNTALSQLPNKLIIANDATTPATYVRGINLASLITQT